MTTVRCHQTYCQYKTQGEDDVKVSPVRVKPGDVVNGKRVTWIGHNHARRLTRKQAWLELQNRGYGNWTEADLPVLLDLARHGYRQQIIQWIRPGTPPVWLKERL